MGEQEGARMKDTLKLPDTITSVEIMNMPELPYALDESLERLRVNISFLGSRYKKIMVVSSVPDEGKSFISLMLWKKLCDAGEKSVYVDADLRKSVFVDKYRIERANREPIMGLSDFLSDKCMLGDTFFRTTIENGCVVPNCKNVTRSSLLLENGKLDSLLSTLSLTNNRVILDVPPLELVSDAEIIAKQCDGAVVVARCGVTNKKIVHRSVRKLERVGCPVLGVVLNRVQTKRSGYYGKRYGAYGYGYGRYYGKKYGDYYGSSN